MSDLPDLPATPEVPASAPESLPPETTAAADAGLTPTSPPEAPQAAPAEVQPGTTSAKPDLSPAACGELLKQHFPALFAGQAKPIKLRVHADIQARAPGVFTKGALSAFFRRYTGSTGYLIALTKAKERLDLDGQAAGEITEEHRQLAREELTRRRQVTREREQQANAQQQAQQAEALQARQSRGALLRDFERTTLTMPNFCALKGLTPEALTPLLEQARKEAAEAPAPRVFDDRRPGPGPRRDGRGPGGRPEGGPRPDRRPEQRGAPPRRDGRGDARTNPDHRSGRPVGDRPPRRDQIAPQAAAVQVEPAASNTAAPQVETIKSED
jgi:sRNA-binding protein